MNKGMMKAAVLRELNKIEVEERPIPEIKTDTDVLVRVKAVGICGTDVHMFREARADVTLPRIMGHELSGVVEQVGSAVTRVGLGDCVVLDPVFSCGVCSACRNGYPNVCEHVRCYGVQMDGGYQEYIVVGEEHLYPFSKQISFDEAALAEPLSIGANIVTRAALKAGESALVIGSGTIGLTVLLEAKSIGARVMVSDIAPQKLALAAKMGADMTVNSKSESLAECAEKFAPHGFDVIVDAVGVAPILESCLNYAAPRGRIVCIGFDNRPASLPPVQITKKELSVIGSRMNCHRFPMVVEQMNTGSIRTEWMISEKYPIAEIQRAFENTIANSAFNIKTLITFD